MKQECAKLCWCRYVCAEDASANGGMVKDFSASLPHELSSNHHKENAEKRESSINGEANKIEFINLLIMKQFPPAHEERMIMMENLIMDEKILAWTWTSLRSRCCQIVARRVRRHRTTKRLHRVHYVRGCCCRFSWDLLDRLSGCFENFCF